MVKMLKKMSAFVFVLAMLLSMLTACGKKVDYTTMLPGEWFVWHWYYNVKDGDNGFFDDAIYYTFNEDGTVEITGDAEDFEAKNGTYEFTGDDTISITYEDGSIDEMSLAANDEDQIQMTNVDTDYTLTLEPMSTWND